MGCAILLCFLFLLRLVRNQIFNCFGSTIDGCLDCAYDSYKPYVGINSPFSISLCKQKESTPNQKEIFISNKKCVVGAPCNGSSSFPYDSWINAFVKEGNLSNSKVFSDLTFKILGSPHFILRKQLPSGREQLFRRVNATITIRPHYCKESNLTGCFPYEEKPIIFVKVDLFYIYIAHTLKLYNITFNGTDFHLHTSSTLNTATANYNLESVVCSISTIGVLFISASKTPCALISKTLKLGEPKDFTRFVGLFNLEGILDSPVIKVPELVIESCDFFMFYSAKLLDGWLAFFVINNNYPTYINVSQSVFSNFRFAMGLIYMHTRENFQLSKSVFYSSFFQNNRSYIELNKITVEAYNDFNIFGNTFTYENLREFDVYGVINVQNLYGDFNISESSFKNIVHRIRRNSLFLLKNLSSITVASSEFRNISLLSNLLLSEKINMVFNLSMFIQLNLYINFMRNYKSNIILQNSNIRDLNVSAQGYTEYETIKHNSGSLYFRNVSFINTSKIVFFFFQVEVGMINLTLEDLDTFFFPLFSVTDSPCTISNLSLKNIQAICQNIFYFKTSIAGNSIAFVLTDIFIFNLSKAVDVYRINETVQLDTILINKTILSIYPLEEFIKAVDVGEWDTFWIKNFIISDLKANTILKIGYMSSIILCSILWENRNSPENAVRLMEATFFKYIQLSSITLRYLMVLDSLISLICSYCKSDLFDFSIESLNTYGKSNILYFRGGNITFRNFNIRAIHFISYPSKPNSFFSIEKGGVMIFNNLTLALTNGNVFTSIIYVYEFQNCLMNLISVRFDEPPDEKYFPRVSIMLLTFVRTVEIDTLISKNLREYVDDFIMTQNGFLNFLGSQSNLILYDDNDFSLRLINIGFINCSKFINGVLGIINYNNVKLENSFVVDSSSQNGGAIYMNYISFAEVANLYLSDNNAIKGGALFLTNIHTVTCVNLRTINTESIVNGGVAYANSVENLLLFESYFINSNSFENGGAFYLERANVSLNHIYAFNISTSAEGGLAYFLKGKLIVNYVFGVNFRAFSGGLIYLQEGDISIIRGAEVKHIFIISKGGVLVIFKVQNFSFVDVLLSEIQGGGAQGNIYIENQEDSFYFFENITIKYSNLLEGNLLFFYSSYKISFGLYKVEISYCEGNLLNIKSNYFSEIYLYNVQFLHNHAKNSDNLVVGFLISLSIKGRENKFINNTAGNAIIAFESSIIYIENAFFSQINIQSAASLYFNFLKSDFTFFLIVVDQISGSFIYHDMGIGQIINMNSSRCYNKASRCFVFIDLDELLIEKCMVQGILGAVMDYLYIQRSNLNMTDTQVFNEPQAGYSASGSDLLLLEPSFALFLRCKFLNFGLAPSIFVYRAKLIKLSKVSFEYPSYILNQNRARQALLIKESNSDLLGCSFINFLGQSGPAFSFYNLEKHSPVMLLMNGTLFEKNRAEFGGAILLQGYINCYLNENVFKLNKAFKSNSIRSGIAGVLYFIGETNCGLHFSLLKNEFVNNSAENFAPTVWSFVEIVLSPTQENIFINNSDSSNFSSELAGLPLKADLSEILIGTDSLNTYNITDGDEERNKFFIISGINFNFNVSVKDKFNQILTFDSKSFGKFHGNELNIQGGTNFSNNGLCFFTDVIVFHNPEEKFTINFTFSFAKEILLPHENQLFLLEDYTWNFSIFSRPCLKGEIYNPDEPSCRLCPDGKYSLKDPMDLSLFIKCEKCPANAVCYSGSFITPLAGYWRANQLSTLIIECFHKDACKGFDIELTPTERIHGRCAVHHSGPLCFFCDPEFARASAKGLCQACKDNVLVYARLIFGLLGIFFYIVLQVRFTFKSNTNSYSGIMIKLLVNHFQQISLISLVDLAWTPNITFYFSLQDYISFLTDEFISVDCLLQKFQYNLLTQRIIFSNVAPILLSLLALLIWTISFTIKSSKSGDLVSSNYLLNRVRVSSLVIVYILHPEILRKCFSLFNCMNLEENKRVLTLSPDVLCWGDDHINFIYISALPGLVLWGILAPFFIWNLFRVNKFAIVKQIKELRLPGDITERNPSKAKNKVGTEEALSIAAKLRKVRPYPTGNFGFVETNSINLEHRKYKRRENVIEINQTQIFNRIMFENGEEESRTQKGEERDNSLQSNKNFSNYRTDRGDGTNYQAKRRKNVIGVKEEQAVSTLKFLFKGYRYKFFYWELMMFLKKIALISIGSLTEVFPGTAKPTVLLIILSFFIFLQTEYSPFEKYFLNRIELLSLVVTFVTSNLGILLYSSDMKKLSSMFLAVIIITNTFFLLFWLWYFFKELISKSAKISILRMLFGNKIWTDQKFTKKKIPMAFNLNN